MYINCGKGELAMDTIKSDRRKRNAKVEIKISPKLNGYLEIYSKTINSTPTKIIEGLVEESLKRDEVQTVLDENEELIKLKRDLEKKESEVAELKARIKEKENQQN